MSDTPKTRQIFNEAATLSTFAHQRRFLFDKMESMERENTKLIGALVELRDKTSCTQGQYAILDDALDEERKRADDGYRSGMETTGL